jgi:hypothetical protein|tara:strand:+ start:371 stop:646 length:276 start_codon:yes stop_codon:yes gene_type:complete
MTPQTTIYTQAYCGKKNNNNPIGTNIMRVDIIGKSFIVPVRLHKQQKDAPSNREHPLLHFFVLYMRQVHIHIHGALNVGCQTKQENSVSGA